MRHNSLFLLAVLCYEKLLEISACRNKDD